MKPRLPTVAERKLWRESNRFTTVKNGQDGEEPEDESDEETVAETTIAVPHKPAAKAKPKTATPASLSPLTTREAGRHFKSRPVDATLDLHGLTKLEAHARVKTFIARAIARHHRHLVIITGKGKGGEMGILRKSLPDWLNEAPLRALISAVAYARPEKGGEGVMHVLLKRVTSGE